MLTWTNFTLAFLNITKVVGNIPYYTIYNNPVSQTFTKCTVRTQLILDILSNLCKTVLRLELTQFSLHQTFHSLHYTVTPVNHSCICLITQLIFNLLNLRKIVWN